MSGRRCILLEPRRLAATRSARFMASVLGEKVGMTVGYMIRGESRAGPSTRILVVTEGVLTRMLHETPDLPGVALVVFDEFHERSIHADLGLAFTLDVQEHLRPDLRLLVMSATLDGLALARVLRDVPVIESRGRVFPVETHYRRFAVDGPVEPAVVQTIQRALSSTTGDLLVFLPGQREIRRAERLLQDLRIPDARIHLLFGDAPPDRQDAALAPDPDGKRKIILATSIAETSLTIGGVRVVIDGGQARGPQFDPRRGMSGLTTGPVSRATADQRRGRAGREAPGVCFRLWTEEQHERLPQYPTPEIFLNDLAPLALDLALWGSPDGRTLRFIDPPPPAHLEQAQTRLKDLGAMDHAGNLTRHGKELAQLPVHPRLSHMILSASGPDARACACDLAAILEDRDMLAGSNDIDIVSRLHALGGGSGADDGVRVRIVREADRLRRLVDAGGRKADSRHAGALVGLAYPERIARRRDGEGRFLMSGGTGAVIPAWSPLAREEFLSIADVDGTGSEVRVFLAAALSKKDLMETFSASLRSSDEIRWDPLEEAVVARRAQRLGAIVVSEQQIPPRGPTIRAAMLDGIRHLGLSALPWDDAARAFRNRSEWLRTHGFVPADWPDVSNASLTAQLEMWLEPFLDGITRRQHLSRLSVGTALRSLFTRSQLRDLDLLAPPAIRVPTGSTIILDYGAGDQPVLAVRLQEMFGQRETPAVAAGRVNVLLHLLSPAGRPLAVTGDLPSFWKTTYQNIRRQMQARYPKHHWPEDPMSAAPTRRTKRRS